jgi:hypothetical protein
MFLKSIKDDEISSLAMQLISSTVHKVRKQRYFDFL